MLGNSLIRRFTSGLLWLVVIVAFADPDGVTSVEDSKFPAVDIAHLLPVHTTSMRPGVLEAQRRPTGVTRPFFLVGCDPRSLAWLERHRERLIELGAFGVVVEAREVAAYGRLEAVAEGLILRPVPGELIAEHLGIEIYPALITAEGVFQDAWSRSASP